MKEIKKGKIIVKEDKYIVSECPFCGGQYAFAIEPEDEICWCGALLKKIEKGRDDIIILYKMDNKE